MAKEKEYRRLPGAGIRRHALVSATRSRLWLGRDHLLSTDTQWYTEDYKRFYFRDIQAIIIHKTESGKIINIVFSALTALPLFAALATGGGASLFWGIVAGCFGLILFINALFGPTCFTHIRTAVQTEELPSLRRLRRANKVLARVRPLIVAAQGDLPVAEIPARMEQLVSHGIAEAVTPAPVAATPDAAPPVIAAALATPIATETAPPADAPPTG
jgi:hypothetical protein